MTPDDSARFTKQLSFQLDKRPDESHLALDGKNSARNRKIGKMTSLLDLFDAQFLGWKGILKAVLPSSLLMASQSADGHVYAPN